MITLKQLEALMEKFGQYWTDDWLNLYDRKIAIKNDIIIITTESINYDLSENLNDQSLYTQTRTQSIYSISPDGSIDEKEKILPPLIPSEEKKKELEQQKESRRQFFEGVKKLNITPEQRQGFRKRPVEFDPDEDEKYRKRLQFKGKQP